MTWLKLTLKAWPVITAVTIGLCFLTQGVAKLLGIELPEQANIELVRRCAGWNWNFAFLCIQVLVIMPAAEELAFRGLIFKLPLWLRNRRRAASAAAESGAWARGFSVPLAIAVISSALFSSAHYLAQPWPDSAFLALFFFGFAQCWLYRRTDRLGCVMLNHALFNLTNLILLFIIPAP